MRFTKKIMDRGTFRLPSDVREALGIEDGDFVELEIVSILKKNAPVTLKDLRQLPLERPQDRIRIVSQSNEWREHPVPPVEEPKP